MAEHVTRLDGWGRERRFNESKVLFRKPDGLIIFQVPSASLELPHTIRVADVLAEAQCSWFCSRDSNCSSFNVLGTARVCQLFYGASNSCVVECSDCELYQVKSSKFLAKSAIHFIQFANLHVFT